MPSASEKIKELQAIQAAERVAREAAERNSLTKREANTQRVEHEHKRKLQRSKEVADRVLSESGVLDEIQAIKRDHIDGKHEESALFINYEESRAQLILVWGTFATTRGADGSTKVVPQRRGFWRQEEWISYDGLEVPVDINNEQLQIGTTVLDKQTWQFNHQVISNAIVEAYINPWHVSPESPDYSNTDGWYPGIRF